MCISLETKTTYFCVMECIHTHKTFYSMPMWVSRLKTSSVVGYVVREGLLQKMVSKRSPRWFGAIIKRRTIQPLRMVKYGPKKVPQCAGLDNMRDPGILDPRHFFSPGTFTRFTRFLHDFTRFLRNFTRFTWFLHDFTRFTHDFTRFLHDFTRFLRFLRYFLPGKNFASQAPKTRGERERLFGSREREGKLKITFPFYGKGTGIRKCYGKGREWEI